LFEWVFRAGDESRLFDTEINERLLNLSTYGYIDHEDYSLADLALKYGLGDRSAEKTDPNGWRLRYSELDGLPANEYPREAYAYALQDATDTAAIFRLQRQRAKESGPGSMNTAAMQAAVRFALLLSTAHGIATDPARVEVLAEQLDRILNDDNLAPLYAAGVLRRPEPPRVRNPKAVERGAEPVLTKGKPASVDTTVLKALVVATCEEYEIPLKKTPTDQVSTDVEVLTELAGCNDVLDKYIERQEVIKLQTTYLPNLRAGVVYADYSVLKETGRTSSRKNKLYPSTNIQNQPRLSGDLSVRECYIPRPGHLFCSVDYSALELCSLAQVIYWMYGHSLLRDLINEGIGLHEYLGAQLCFHLDDVFRQVAGGTEQRETYRLFMAMKKADPEKFGLYRTFAKPTGLGYPGGLGPKKFRSYAKATYKLPVSLEMATQLRDLYFFTFPEVKRYLRDINLDADPNNAERYCYTTPLGMYRAGATYCAVANGKGLQSPSAEGAKAAVWAVTRACYDPSVESILFGCRMMAFIHDEIILELPDDGYAHERSLELSKIMRNSMAKLLPDVTISAEPSLMGRWYKEAKAVYVEGRLVQWRP
jgi:DNA polymerase-1